MINWFSNSGEKFFNIVSHPFYDLKLVIKFLDKILSQNKRVLYITHNESFVKEMIEREGIILKGEIIFSSLFLTFDKNKEIDLVIFDDISGDSRIEDGFIFPFLEEIKCFKKIILSMKELIQKNVIYLVNDDLTLFNEPRSIQTKIDLNYDMPHVVFEFLEWFMINKRKVILITKDKNSSKNVFRYMKKYISLSSKLNNLFIEDDFKSFEEFERNNNEKCYIYITSYDSLNEFENFVMNKHKREENFNIVLFFASSRVFNYKNLLNLCGITNFLKDCKNEIIFVSNHENIEILTTKKISRSYNQRLWEYGLGKY